ncbi:hypothetical protein THRCLA_23100 [Thraustotheca clavata]|uniref:Uncharacterized protein n=1 Tax=Thraustotheca clavata TaxID=74557 RepID=A0A1V9YEB4_9STRA|nr:hypothetical protein THRCLA_23100 [Thraustotheca clavata]
MRLLFNMLPVNARFGYLQTTLRLSAADAVETQNYAFQDCPRIRALWDFHSTAWDCFGVDFNWSSISDLEMFMTNQLGSHHYDTLYILWSLLIASLLHSIWV